MNPFGLTATALVVWGIVAHLLADWPLQNAWMAAHKAERRKRVVPDPNGRPPRDLYDMTETIKMPGPWWDRHPAAYVHAGIHGLALAPVFGWPAALIAVAHLLIDTRTPLAWWSRLIDQDQPQGKRAATDAVFEASRRELIDAPTFGTDYMRLRMRPVETVAVYDMGIEVRIWTDQVAHILVIAIMALAVAAL